MLFWGIKLFRNSLHEFLNPSHYRVGFKMKINKGVLWFGWEWEKAIKEHIKTSDCYFLEVYKDVSNHLLNNEWVFNCFKLQGYGNRFKEYKTIIPKRFYNLVKELKVLNENKFKVVDNYGNKIKEVLK